MSGALLHSFLLPLFFLLVLFLFPHSAAAQEVGGNVYGGGNKGNVLGRTTVNVKGGNLNKVFGGARMANVGGNSYLNIDGAHATGYTVINYAFGGNDIAGTIGTAKAVDKPMPAELTGNKDGVDDTWNTYVHLSAKTLSSPVYYTQAECDEYNSAHGLSAGDPDFRTTDHVKTSAVVDPTNESIYIGQLFAGGNGDYTYTDEEGNPLTDGEGNYVVKSGDDIIATRATPFNTPDLTKTYLDVQGGSIVYAYGGGNKATITEKTVIHVDNPTEVVNSITDAAYVTGENPTGELLTMDRFEFDMGINTGFSFPSSGAFQIGRFFGGNNLAEMAIRPTWNLQSGKIRNLYSGGNKGAMTSPDGLLLEISPTSTLIVDNLYGGCRMADVYPKKDGLYTPVLNLPGYHFPDGLAARVLVKGGDVNNVYGGNDVTGKVYGGNAVGIRTSVRGDVYGGGNGAYPYTDDPALMDDDIYGDFYYESDGTPESLNAFRPNAEQVSLRLHGVDAEHPTIIGGAVYLGGNCATLKNARENPMVDLKIGSHVIADNVFLGNNGEKMISSSLLESYHAHNSLPLTDPVTFAGYMKGAAMELMPNVVFDRRAEGDPDDYLPYSTYIGSFYCGGNVGSMMIPGKNTFHFDQGLIIYNKLVGGCNNARVEAGTYNAAFDGGIIGADNEQGNNPGEYYTDNGAATGKIKDRIELNLQNVVVQPKRWDDVFSPVDAGDLVGGKLKPGYEFYTSESRGSRFVSVGTEVVDLGAAVKYYKLTSRGSELVWNTVKWDDVENGFVHTGIGSDSDTSDDEVRRLMGGNVYGGCYNSGHVNGNVVININRDLHQRDVLFAEADDEDPYTMAAGGERRTGVLKMAQADDVMSISLAVFGAGYGKNTEIWGSTTVNLNEGYALQAYGGGEKGVVGKKNDSGEYEYNAAYSTTVNLKGANAGYSEETTGGVLAEAEYLYGAGNEGDVCGDSYVYLGNGRIYDAFGGACNADILGAAEVHIGYEGGFPWVCDNIYGGNDFGGIIKGSKNHTTQTGRVPFDLNLMRSSTYVKYIQGRVDSLFGGCYGSYDYTDRIYKNYTDADGRPLTDGEGNPLFSYPHMDDNSLVHFVPADNSSNHVGVIFGASEGYPGNNTLNNAMHEESYVLVDDTKTKEKDRFEEMDIFGGGAFAGLGSAAGLGAGRAAIDLFAGSFHNIYGGCNHEGLIGYTRVNVPSTSTARVNALYGGGQGYTAAEMDAYPALHSRYCDHYVTCIDFLSNNAIVEDAIYGGNHNSRIAADTYINMQAPARQSSGYQATIYGGGHGNLTVSGRTNVFMNNGSAAYKVFGGGRDGKVLNFASLTQWLGGQFLAGGTPAGDVATKVTDYGDILRTFGTYLASNPIHLPTAIGTYPNMSGLYDGTYANDLITNPDFYNTNVHLMDGCDITGYAYGGGYGSDASVAGTTYIELKGGLVDRDIYGGGEGGPVFDEYGLKTFTAATNVYVEGGMARNVYGGGYLGHVGKHVGAISASNAGDIPGEANVTIGMVDGVNFYHGIPAIQRNAYGGGEGGSVYGTANLTINNGYIGYRYKNLAAAGQTPDYQYVPELDDQTPNAIEMAGNVFGGGYVVNSYVDEANVEMYGGILRGSLYGGGEVGPIGRGTMKADAPLGGGIKNGDATIYKAGKTSVKVFDGLISRNVFGGGRGHDSWGGDGTMYMDKEVLKTVDLKCKGYVFGQTDVTIHGGEIGTDEGLALGYGNVFGGGDIGSVYSAYELDGSLYFGKKTGVRYDGTDEGYYYKYNGSAYVDDEGTSLGGSAEKHLTEDCKVVVEPWCKANTSVTINDSTFAAGSYVPTSYLNYLGNKTASAADWTALGKTDVNKEGIIIHNAVFAGGNTSPGSTEVYANTTTVFGNATASIHDAYNRDLITIGTNRTGGLYGDGNLTLVGGYRELNITNYGTDYYHINPEISLEAYKALPIREGAYYEIRYKCLQQCTDKDGKTYAVTSNITADEMQTVFEGVKVWDSEKADSVYMIQPNGKPLEAYWKENGVCSRYAGRLMNTIQRADFCGVFGSRMVMRGAQDRVPETVDYTNYTINRVREVSLNKKISVRSGDASDAKNKEHGNYFGIYSVVNFLGALTSDLDFHTAVRTTDNEDTGTYHATAKGKTYGNATYYDWKDEFHDDRRRNNGNSHNKLALASGVFLELTNENGTGPGLLEKKWGLITGVVELDLINVQPGMGGGYVYAKNEHGIRSGSGKTHTILTALNTGAVTNKAFIYDETEGTKKEWETSGNFIHSTQTIIDDCYNVGNKYHNEYMPPEGVPAHYWYIKGAVYIYDQYISAFTGSPNAYSEVVSIPLTISSASHGRLKLLNVQPNYYAHYSVNSGSTKTVLGKDDKIELRDVVYGRNDAINFWDYNQLTAAEKALFEKETYVVTADCTVDGVTYVAGTVLLPSEYTALKETATTVHHTAKDKDVDFDFVFRSSNNVSHDTGYILTYQIDNPQQWDTWYSKADGSDPKNQTGGAGFEGGPTYTPTATGLYGQTSYSVGSIISKTDYDTYHSVPSSVIPTTTNPEDENYQAKFYPAYIVTADVLETNNKNSTAQRFHKGATLSKEDYKDAQWDAIESSVASAYVATSTIQLTPTQFIYRDTYMTAAEMEAYKTNYPSLATTIASTVQPAYYCTTAGKYGGNYYEAGHNYRGLAAFSAMSADDRENFTFNYDALDLLIDSTYSRAEGVKYQYDGKGFTTPEKARTNLATYSLPTPIDYTATYKGSESFKYIDDNGGEQTIKTDGTSELTRSEYERLPNEQYYWAPVVVGEAGNYYVVKQTIVLGDTPYAAGQVITKDTYDGLNAGDKEKVATLNFTTPGTYYYCREAYTIPNDANGHAVNSETTGVTGGTGGNYAKNTEVPMGVIINDVSYNGLTNLQKNFSIHGKAPTETSMLYVPRNSDIFDLSAEKIITVVYQYDYVESDMDGTHITPVSERHVLNIHLNFKSGVPTVEDISAPNIILPGTSISIPEPYVTPGAYEITGGGWKLFDNEPDAESHRNGVEYRPTIDPLYLYQNKYYLSYYAKTYLGETYSNYVPVSVANYHDLKAVIDSVKHHYYIDHKDVIDKGIRPKIYINDYSGSDQNGLDMFKSLYDLSVLSSPSVDPVTGLINSGTFVGHKPLDETRVAAGENLEFFLRTDIDHSTKPNPDYDPEDPASPERIPDPWTPIGTDAATCFQGRLHGDGHTLKGLDHSLFNYLCGDVYNLGVMGSFTGAGVAETGSGYVESCWVKSSAPAVSGSVKAVFGDPKGEGQTTVNCYYSSDNAYAPGPANKMPDDAFYNGEVAYDLNNFYLYKRYSDKEVKSGMSYKYWKAGEAEPMTGYYGSHPEECSSGFNGNIAYVEDRFADGDFRYAAGTIPSSADERMVVDPEDPTKEYFYPIWPDDYLFFGQRLNYGYSATYAHDDTPTAIVRFNGHLSTNPDANRVYRAPAYYRSKVMNVAHFNPHAYLAAKSKDGLKDAHPNMTAIDFDGHNDTHVEPTHALKPYKLGMSDGQFYRPLLDDDGLLSIVNIDETRNLLVYAPAASGDGYVNSATHGVLTSYFEDPDYDDYYDNSDEYRLVADASPVVSSIYGHLVQDGLVATNDHLLVDKQDFNAPIAYDFDGDHRMWYQRVPDNYVELVWSGEPATQSTRGWESVSLPFTAELVTTSDKGEITHFYGGSEESKNGTGTKLGHEYWLREFTNITGSAPAVASFLYPGLGAATKTVTNTFLWDYYYENTVGHNRLDRNNDTYQNYYSTARSYENYPLLTAATPYIIGFPSATFYEFDLSGNFTALNTAVAVDKLGRQTVTFASNTGVTIGVSDDETENGVLQSGYVFRPTYMKQALDAGINAYTMSAAGDSYDKVPATGDATQVEAFRPYFTAAAGGGVKKEFTTRIIFNGGYNDLDEDQPTSAMPGDLIIYAQGRTIITKSTLEEPTTVRIVNLGGVTIANYIIQPGETIETPVQAHGAYIVNKKKVFVK